MRRKVFGVVALMALAACGSGKSKKKDSGQDREYTTMKAQVSQRNLGLAGATLTYAARITGCVSGWQSAALTEANTSVTIPNLDSGCQYKLLTVVVNGETFDTSSQNFSLNSEFISTGGALTQLSFKVVSQLASPIAGPQSVNITFAVLQKGTGSSASAATTAGISVSGASPIDLGIGKTTITAIDSVTGAGKFQFKLGCSEAVAAGVCKGVGLAGIKLGLAKYTGDLDLTSCRALAESGAAGVVVAPGDPDIANGGILSSELVGPSAIYTVGNTDLVLAARSAEGGCKYYRVTVLVP